MILHKSLREPHIYHPIGYMRSDTDAADHTSDPGDTESGVYEVNKCILHKGSVAQWPKIRMTLGQEQRSFFFCSKTPAQISFVDILAGIWRTLINSLVFLFSFMLFLFHGDGSADAPLESWHAAC